MTDLLYTTINAQHEIGTVRGELAEKGYYLANTGQTCDEQALTALIEALGGFWQQGTKQVVAPLNNPTFIAETTDEIPPHNECAYAAQPPRYLALHCQENQVEGGDFFLVDSQAVLQEMGAVMLSLLYHAKFQCLINPAQPELVSLVQQSKTGEFHLQYSCIGHDASWTGHSGYRPTAPFYQDYETIIPTLQSQLKREALRHYHSWQTGDLLIVNNQRFLHGRNAFQGNERKLDHLRIR